MHFAFLLVASCCFCPSRISPLEWEIPPFFRKLFNKKNLLVSLSFCRVLLISKAAQPCTVEIWFVSNRQANKSKCLRIYASWKSWKWEKPESNQMNVKVVLYTQSFWISSWDVSLQTNTLSTLYILYKSLLSSNTAECFTENIPMFTRGCGSLWGEKDCVSSDRQLAQQCSAGREKCSIWREPL